MKVGDRVRVSTTVEVYHHPAHRGKPYDLEGQEGEIIANATEHQGRPISANFPWVVQFEGKFRGHFRDHELTVIED
ncbi:MAG: ferredoxin--nitrite reductase [Oscillatoriales cyanobacterium]|nr:MAG: ferredoxin--nitrite reductase [Oscillatoriales cyanobacterium]